MLIYLLTNSIYKKILLNVVCKLLQNYTETVVQLSQETLLIIILKIIKRGTELCDNDDHGTANFICMCRPCFIPRSVSIVKMYYIRHTDFCQFTPIYVP